MQLRQNRCLRLSYAAFESAVFRRSGGTAVTYRVGQRLKRAQLGDRRKIDTLFAEGCW